ncbi:MULTISPECIES: nucleoside triphosphate pyrophosphohydrolase family protein [Pirellulaceae]|nr:MULTISPECIES: nucleoside triphosphate pyrophosphohydrolase family protein [Pirellulaceae]
MDAARQQVAEFHRQIGASIAPQPRLLPHDKKDAADAQAKMRELLLYLQEHRQEGDELQLRLCLALEELTEWVEAHVADDLIAAADAWGDRAYVLLGDAVSADMPAEAIFHEVHRSNLSKRQANSKNGKGVKDGQFQPPDLGSVLRQHRPLE